MIKELKSWGLLLLLAVIWGSSFILMKKGMFNENGDAIFSAPQVASLRILIAAIVLLPLLGSIISGFFGKRIGVKSCQFLTSTFVSVSAILSILIFLSRTSSRL